MTSQKIAPPNLTSSEEHLGKGRLSPDQAVIIHTPLQVHIVLSTALCLLSSLMSPVVCHQGKTIAEVKGLRGTTSLYQVMGNVYDCYYENK